MKIVLLLLLLSTVQHAAFAQKHADFWYFGQHAALDFSSGDPVAVKNSMMVAEEGSATISDASGNLLFYSPGVIIFNRNHTAMQNGTDLYGCGSSTQSALVVPAPSNSDRYYLFTNDCAEDSCKLGLAYSVVDMTLDNGLGAVIQKNVPLCQPGTEKLTAVSHSNGRDVWLISHELNTNAFVSYLISDTGIDPVPVKTSIGTIYSFDSGGIAGQLKVSPDGKKIAAAKFGQDTSLELFDFDASTGKLSNRIALEFPRPGCYGVEFSPDGKKVYTIAIGGFDSSVLYQFELSGSWTPAMINVTRRGIHVFHHYGPTNEMGAASLQLGPDKKIYVARIYNDYLGVIKTPNNYYWCNYSDSSIYLGGASSVIVRHKSTSGLPGFVQSYFLSYAAGIAQEEAPQLLRAYPNPSSSEITFLANNLEGGNSLIIYNAAGAEVSSHTFRGPSFKLHRNNLPAGMYFARLVNEKGLTAAEKFFFRD
jgi:hypothetical protein